MTQARQAATLAAMLRLLLLFPLTISAADFYVSPSGLDTNPGTLATPWKTIQKAANTLA